MLTRIKIDPKVCGGRPTIRGMRYTVDFVLKLLGDGYTADDIVRLYPELCRMNAGAALRPVTASLGRLEPRQTDPYERFFGCPVRFGAAEDALVLSVQDADRPLPSSNIQLAAVFDRMLTEELARLDRSDLVSRCHAELLEHFASGEMDELEMAKRLRMSRRTLQRRLAETDTTYLQLVDDTRKDLALRYIEDETRSITDIAFTLGFSQQSAFTRAFKRWTGVSPTKYRLRAEVDRSPPGTLARPKKIGAPG